VAHKSIGVLRRASCGVRNTANALHQPGVQPVNGLELPHDGYGDVDLQQ
jgi:hypothetical protein